MVKNQGSRKLPFTKATEAISSGIESRRRARVAQDPIIPGVPRERESVPQIPEQYSEKWVQVDGLRVRYLHSGSGPALILVHGLLGYSANWHYAIPLLAKSYEVFVPDLPGSGLSECSPDLDCTLSGAAGRLLRFLDAVGVDTCDLVGSSYGGATA